MIVGNPSIFAIESTIGRAYENPGLRALGFFAIHVCGNCYGVRSPDTTFLACSYDEVQRRIGKRGSHTAPFASEPDAGEIAHAFRSAVYGEEQWKSYFGIPCSEFDKVVEVNRIMWAPDGDEAFDDGSYILQFDVDDHVRLIAFKSGQDCLYDPPSLAEAWLAADHFYDVLERWHRSFEAEWASLPKVPADSGG